MKVKGVVIAVGIFSAEWFLGTNTYKVRGLSRTCEPRLHSTRHVQLINQID